ncbi:MAG: flagellar hook protein FlgE [Caulobacterales bacterium]|nr:flagellar hook protein FlgE [Caulobacterales bacterium]
MSLNSALIAGTSSLLANSSALAALSDNISNVGTTAYKRSVTTFDPLVETGGNVNSYAAGGVSVVSRQLVSQQGLLERSDSATDIGLSGAGFFVVSQSPDPLPGDGRLFTRSGSFSPDENGDLRNTAGYYLQGWPVQPDGTVNTNPTDLNGLETVNVGAIGGTAEATSRMQFNANLQSSTPVSAAVSGGTYNSAANNMASGAVDADFSASVQVFDSQGTLRTINYGFLKSNTPNVWHVEVYVTPATDVVTGGGLSDGQIAVGDVAFTSDGVFNPTSPDTTLPTTLTFGAFDAAAPGAGAVNWAAATGVAAQTIELDLGGASSTGGLSQLDSPSTLLSSTVDGSVFGDLAGVEIDDQGMVIARFNNGVSREVYQLPVATFLNPDGLRTQKSGGAYVVTGESGQFTLKEAGVGGAGTISPNALEASTVDLGSEFTGLITTQRAYSAASKVITTADEMLEELIRIKR